MKRVLLLLCKGTEVYEAAALYDVLGWSGDCGGEPVEVVTAGRTDEVTCTFGLRILPDTVLADVDPSRFDALAVPGGFESFGFYEDAYSDEVGDLIRRFEGHGRTIASICVGALPVARSGILAGRTATTYHLMGGRRRRQLADLGVEVLDLPVVRDGGVITSTSPATAMDVAFALLADLTGDDNADRVRREMGFGDQIGIGDSSPVNGVLMIDHVILNVRSVAASRAFYEKALAPLGYGVVMEMPWGVGFGTGAKPVFFIAEREPSHTTVHVAFATEARPAVDAFHASALEAGGTDNGKPGLREHYHPNYYGAFVFDPDGNNVEAVCHAPAG